MIFSYQLKGIHKCLVPLTPIGINALAESNTICHQAILSLLAGTVEKLSAERSRVGSVHLCCLEEEGV